MALTTNGGHTFTPVFAPVLFTEARYAAFPSDNVWYIAAGEWPGNSTGFDAEKTIIDPVTRDMPRRYRRSMFQDANGRFPRHFVPKTVGDDTGYTAQIAKVGGEGKRRRGRGKMMGEKGVADIPPSVDHRRRQDLDHRLVPEQHHLHERH